MSLFICLESRAKSHSSRTRLALSSSRERRSRSSMLSSLSAGTFECGRPQIVFERGLESLSLSQNFARNSKFGMCVRKPRSRTEPGLISWSASVGALPPAAPLTLAVRELDAARNSCHHVRLFGAKSAAIRPTKVILISLSLLVAMKGTISPPP